MTSESLRLRSVDVLYPGSVNYWVGKMETFKDCSELGYYMFNMEHELKDKAEHLKRWKESESYLKFMDQLRVRYNSEKFRAKYSKIIDVEIMAMNNLSSIEGETMFRVERNELNHILNAEIAKEIPMKSNIFTDDVVYVDEVEEYEEYDDEDDVSDRIVPSGSPENNEENNKFDRTSLHDSNKIEPPLRTDDHEEYDEYHEDSHTDDLVGNNISVPSVQVSNEASSGDGNDFVNETCSSTKAVGNEVQYSTSIHKIHQLEIIESRIPLVDHPLLREFRKDLLKLMQHQLCIQFPDNPLDHHILILSRETPDVDTILQGIKAILVNKPVSSFMGGQKNLYSIFESLEIIERMDIINEFESSEEVRLLLSNKNHSTEHKCTLFLKFLLEMRYLHKLTADLLSCDLYREECYEQGSLMLSHQHKDSILSILTFIQRSFSFDFGFSKSRPNSVGLENLLSPEIAKLNLDLTKQVKTITDYFASKTDSMGCDAEDIGDELQNPGIGQLIRNILCPLLLKMLSCGLNQNDGWFVRFTPGCVSHFWSVIEFCANATDIQQSITNSYDLSGMVQTINELVNSRRYSILSKDELSTKKFNSFVCYCLNYKILHKSLAVLFSRRFMPIISKYYKQDAVFVKPSITSHLFQNLKPLSELPFVLHEM